MCEKIQKLWDCYCKEEIKTVKGCPGYKKNGACDQIAIITLDKQDGKSWRCRRCYSV